MKKYYTLFHPDSITPELKEELKEASLAGNMELIYPLGGRWILAAGVDWPTANHPNSMQEGETTEGYVARMSLEIETLFDINLPNGLVVDKLQLDLIKQSERWKAVEATLSNI